MVLVLIISVQQQTLRHYLVCAVIHRTSLTCFWRLSLVDSKNLLIHLVVWRLFVCRFWLHSHILIDTNKVGYHRECYSHFTSHQDKLVCHRESAPSSPPRPQRTPEKKPTPIKSPLSPQFRLFPEKCVFCESKCKRVCGRNPVFCKPFPTPLKGKDPSWKNLADQALTMGNT